MLLIALSVKVTPRPHSDESSLQHHFDNAICTSLRGWPRLDDFKSRLLQQLSPLRLSPLHASVESHHDQVKHSSELVCSLFRDDQIVNQQLGVAWRHRLLDLLQHFQTVLFRPVVQDVMIKVDTSACVRLSRFFLMRTDIEVQE